MSKKKLKLKGNNTKRIPKSKKIKMQKTLDRMAKTRENDTKNLRTAIEAKLKWAEMEKVKGLKIIENIRNQVIKLSGSIAVLKELLEGQKEKKK